MGKIRQKLEKGKRLFSHSMDSCRFKPGDHIYAYRGLGSYSHHGIYIGENCVIHFTPTEKSGIKSEATPCPKCGYQPGIHLGVLKSCLDCFLSHGALSSESLHLYGYEECSLLKGLKRPGSCSTSKCLPPEKVVQIATQLHKENCFGFYHLLDNNCEDFATFCKTGVRRSEQANTVPHMASFLVNLLKHNKNHRLDA